MDENHAAELSVREKIKRWKLEEQMRNVGRGHTATAEPEHLQRAAGLWNPSPRRWGPPVAAGSAPMSTSRPSSSAAARNTAIPDKYWTTPAAAGFRPTSTSPSAAENSMAPEAPPAEETMDLQQNSRFRHELVELARALPVEYPLSYPVMEQSLREFIGWFYMVSDRRWLTEEWVACFRETATLIMGPKVAYGLAEIRQLRMGMWNDVVSRKHTVGRVFPASFEGWMGGACWIEFMIFGSVEYVMMMTESKKIEWAGHARVVRDGVNSPWKFIYYRVWL